jgi:galactonate dehydratase
MSRSSHTPTFARRQLIGFGCAAGAALWAEQVSIAQNPATSVADRTSSIRLTSLRATICRDRVFVKLGTNQGVSGWGEIKGVVPTVAKALAEAMFDLLDGQNPTRIEHCRQRSIVRSATSAARLHGARDCRHRHGRCGTLLANCGACPSIGYLAARRATRSVSILPAKQSRSATVRSRNRAIRPTSRRWSNRSASLVSRVGKEGSVMFDAHSASPATLIQFARPLNLTTSCFSKSPPYRGTLRRLRIKQQVKIPLACGERDRTIWGILPYLAENAIDIVQPDCGYTGGITQMKKIATLAEAYYVPLAPHCTQSYLGMTASFHVVASVPLFLIHESYDDELWGKIIRRNWTKSADGQVTLPKAPDCASVDEAPAPPP